MHEERFPLESLIEGVDVLTALGFSFHPIRFASANTFFTLLSRATRLFDPEDHATSNVVPCDRPLLYFVHIISLLIPS